MSDFEVIVLLMINYTSILLLLQYGIIYKTLKTCSLTKSKGNEKLIVLVKI